MGLSLSLKNPLKNVKYSAYESVIHYEYLAVAIDETLCGDRINYGYLKLILPLKMHL